MVPGRLLPRRGQGEETFFAVELAGEADAARQRHVTAILVFGAESAGRRGSGTAGEVADPEHRGGQGRMDDGVEPIHGEAGGDHQLGAHALAAEVLDGGDEPGSDEAWRPSVLVGQLAEAPGSRQLVE